MTIIRTSGHHAESLEKLISGLEDGSRSLSQLEMAHILKELSDAIETCKNGV
jgi:hypothetical protein